MVNPDAYGRGWTGDAAEEPWPWSATRKEWFRITRELVARTIADMELDPAALAEVEEAFIGAGLL